MRRALIVQDIRAHLGGFMGKPDDAVDAVELKALAAWVAGYLQAAIELQAAEAVAVNANRRFHELQAQR